MSCTPVRGTPPGIELAVQTALGVRVQVVETGAAAWSSQPGGDLPGDPVPAVVVVARPQAGQDVERRSGSTRWSGRSSLAHCASTRVQVAPEDRAAQR